MSLKLTIFFSWQSDIKGNRNIIVNAIKPECQKLKEDKGYVVELDEATRNLPGSPKIEDAVLSKINKADIFVCDITPITSVNGKLLPNPNVLFELGYASKVMGFSRIILMARKGDWDVSDMPFDINHHRIGIFTSAKDCDLSFEINSCVEYCVQHPLRYWNTGDFLYGITSIIPSFCKTKNSKASSLQLKATEESTVFFGRRMSEAFPGNRGMFEITDIKQIKSSLSRLLQYPLEFSDGLEHATCDPIWIFRGGSAEHIESFRPLSGRKVLIGFEEVIVKRIVIYRDNARYYSQYVYVETLPDKPCGCYKYEKDEIESFAKDLGYFDEEFALFKPKWYLPTKKITRQEYDDGATLFAGKHVKTYGKAELRLRYLTPYNFVIAAKFSPFNSRDFCRISESVFNGILNGAVSNEDFDKFMKVFPKREW